MTITATPTAPTAGADVDLSELEKAAMEDDQCIVLTFFEEVPCPEPVAYIAGLKCGEHVFTCVRHHDYLMRQSSGLAGAGLRCSHVRTPAAEIVWRRA
jgi:hypothetical protein